VGPDFSGVMDCYAGRRGDQQVDTMTCHRLAVWIERRGAQIHQALLRSEREGRTSSTSDSTRSSSPAVVPAAGQRSSSCQAPRSPPAIGAPAVDQEPHGGARCASSSPRARRRVALAAASSSYETAGDVIAGQSSLSGPSRRRLAGAEIAAEKSSGKAFGRGFRLQVSMTARASGSRRRGTPDRGA